MKLKPKSLAKLVGLGAGAFFGGPLLACLGSTCGGFIGELFETEDDGGWDLGAGFSGVMGNLFAGKLQPIFEDAPSGFNHDLRRAAARALLVALEWKNKPGPLAAALLKHGPFAGMSAARREMLKRLILHWHDQLSAKLKTAEKNKDSALLLTLFPRGDSDSLVRLSDGKLTAEQHTAAIWAAFYQQTLQPLLDSIENRDERGCFDHADLQEHVSACLAAVFPGCFSEALKSPDQKRAWIAYQKTLLLAIQRAIYDIGAQTKRLPAVEGKIDLLVENTKASKEWQQKLSSFLESVKPSLDGQWDATRKIQSIVTSIQDSLDELHAEYQKIDPLSLYKDALFEAFAHYVEIGQPKVSGISLDARKALIGDIFVDPRCAGARISPARLDADIQAGRPLPGEDLLPLLQQAFTSEAPHVVLLGDPGMGKSTLVRWLAVSPLLTGSRRKLAEIQPASLPACLKDAIPLPFIIRDLVRHMPRELAAWNWQALLSAFREFRATVSAVRPLLHPFAAHEPAFEALLSNPNAIFLIDGLDEIGDPPKRRAMSAAIMEGFAALPAARFLVTSRIIGYEEAPVHLRLVAQGAGLAAALAGGRRPVALRHPEKGIVFTSEEDAAKYDDEWERGDVVAESAALRERLASLLYLSPFTNPQQDKYALQWFAVRVGQQKGRDRAKALLEEARRKPSIRIISRIPNLLCMMALLKTHDVPLPDGRAELYADISEAYLKTIHAAIGLDPVLHGHSLPCTREEAETWLSIISVHLQERRVQSLREVNLARRAGSQPASEDGDEILATRDEMLAWLRPLIEAERPSDDPSRLLGDFLRFITQRTAFLLERGEGKYGFAHLSFLEYYSARWMAAEVQRLLKNRAPKAWQADALVFTKQRLHDLSRLSAWQEPLHFLAEIVSMGDREDLAEILSWKFPWFPWAAPQPAASTGPLLKPDLQSARLLAALSLDKKVSLFETSRISIWSRLWSLHLAFQPVDLFPGNVPWTIAPALLDASDFQERVITELERQLPAADRIFLDDCPAIRSLDFLKAGANLRQLTLRHCIGLDSQAFAVLRELPSLNKLSLMRCASLPDIHMLAELQEITALSLTGCTAVSDLGALRGLGKLQKLFLTGCTGVSDLGALRGLGQLQWLNLDGCTGVSNLEALRGLDQLQTLFLSGCTAVSDLGALRGLGQLQKLSLSGCTAVSDLGALRGLGKLQVLSLSGCTGVKDREAQIADLQKELPNCNIYG